MSRADQLLGLFRRFPFSAACVVVTLLSALAAWYLSGENENLEIVRRDRAKEGEATLSLLVGGSTQRQELDFVRGIARRIEDNLVIESNLAENAFYFYKFEEQTRVRLPELHPLNSPGTDPSPLFRRVPYTLRVSGTYEQVAAFLFALETGPRLANITSFNFGRRPEGISLDLSVELLGKK
jgi:hypothetical protein